MVKSILALFIGAAALLAGCGQPGPLYMPKPPAKPAPAAAQPMPPPPPPSPSPAFQ
ncbi:MAG: lipoprotein [Massilia sp.]|nr:lipoprotein [Massilia sp.]